jgi:hypothetical protein
MGNQSRFELRKTQEQQRMLPYYEAIKAILSTLPPHVLDLIDLPEDVINDVDMTRMDDDNVGRSAAMYGFFLSNMTLTPQDRIVAAQILCSTASNLLNETVLTKNNLDKIGALKNTTILSDIGGWFDEASGMPGLTGDAEREEVGRLDTYVEQYNKAIKDETMRWTESDVVGDDETPKTLSWWAKLIDVIPGINW